MSTLTEMRESLEQLEQDAAAFRYLLAHPISGVAIIEEARSYYDSSREFESSVREHLRALVAKTARSIEG